MATITERSDIETYLRDPAADVSGFTVVAIDDRAGTVASTQDAVDDGHMVVHVGPPIIGSDVVVETEVVTAIDTDQREIHVDRIADWVKASPKLKHYQQT